MTSEDLRKIFKNACTAEPLAEGWPELEKFGKAVIDACMGVCEDARDCADFNKMAKNVDGSPYYDHEKLDVVISVLDGCIATMRFNVGSQRVAEGDPLE
jgi:hypothetical protein